MSLLPQSQNAGLLIVGHGTRDDVGCEEFLLTARAVAQCLPNVAIEPCFLELAEPTIHIAVKRLADRGIERLVVLPLLLFSAGHAKDDIPRAVDQAVCAAKLSKGLGLQPIEQLPHLGCHPKLLELSALRFNEVIAEHVRYDAPDTALLMVGRGSRDVDATAEMLRFASLRHDAKTVQQTDVGFVAMAEPPLQQCLDELSRSHLRQIVVQPHLLFAGQLLSKIDELVAAMSAKHPKKEWIVTRHLGPHALLEDAIVDLVTNCLQSDARTSGGLTT